MKKALAVTVCVLFFSFPGNRIMSSSFNEHAPGKDKREYILIRLLKDSSKDVGGI